MCPFAAPPAIISFSIAEEGEDCGRDRSGRRFGRDRSGWRRRSNNVARAARLVFFGLFNLIGGLLRLVSTAGVVVFLVRISHGLFPKCFSCEDFTRTNQSDLDGPAL